MANFLQQPIDSTYQYVNAAQSMIDFMKDPNHPEYKRIFALCLQKIEDKELIKRLEIAFYNNEAILEKNERLTQSIKEELKEEEERKEMIADTEQSAKQSLEEKNIIEKIFSNIVELQRTESELQEAIRCRDELNDNWQKVQDETAENVIKHLQNGITLPNGHEIQLEDTDEIKKILTKTLSPSDFIKKTQFDVQMQSHMHDIKREKEAKGLPYDALAAEKVVKKAVTNKLTHVQEYNFIMAVLKAINNQLPEEHQDNTPGFVKKISSQIKEFMVEQADKLSEIFEKEIENSHLIKSLEKTCQEKFSGLVSVCNSISESSSAFLKDTVSMVKGAFNSIFSSPGSKKKPSITD